MPRTEFAITQGGEVIALSTVESTQAKCDFCSRPVGGTCFVAKDMTMTVMPEATDANPLNLKEVKLNSDAHWAACDPCATLVRANDQRGLYERSYAAAPPDIKQGGGAVYLMAIQAALFWAAFDGVEHAGREHPEHPDHDPER
jgi:hypothetical protein